MTRSSLDMAFDAYILIRQNKWSAVYSVHTILLSLQSLLGGEHAAIGYVVIL